MSRKRSDMTVPIAPVAEVPRLALSIRELATSLGVSARSVAGWVADGTGPPSFVQGRLRLFPLDTAREWLEQRARASEQDDTDGDGQGEIT